MENFKQIGIVLLSILLGASLTYVCLSNSVKNKGASLILITCIIGISLYLCKENSSFQDLSASSVIGFGFYKFKENIPLGKIKNYWDKEMIGKARQQSGFLGGDIMNMPLSQGGVLAFGIWDNPKTHSEWVSRGNWKFPPDWVESEVHKMSLLVD